VRVGKSVTYQPTDAEATAGGGSFGDYWPAKITLVAATTVNLAVFRANGSMLAKTGVLRGGTKGTFGLQGLAELGS